MATEIDIISAIITEDPSRTIYDVIAEDNRAVRQAYKEWLQLATSTFQHVSDDPSGLYQYIMNGMKTSDRLIADDNNYWRRMQPMWKNIDNQTYDKIVTNAKQYSKELENHFKRNTLTEHVVVEGIGLQILGFMGKIALALAAL